jgi:hypothetical protein
VAKKQADCIQWFKHALFARRVNNRLIEEGFEAFKLVDYANPDRSADSLITEKLTYFSKGQPDSLKYWKEKESLQVNITKLLPDELTKKDMISASNQPGLYNWALKGDKILVVYSPNGKFPDFKRLNNIGNLNFILDKTSNKELTLVNFAEPALFNKNGVVVNPNSMQMLGVWAKNRVADILPETYEPSTDENAPVVASSDTAIKKIAANLNSVIKALPVEKVYLQTDREFICRGTGFGLKLTRCPVPTTAFQNWAGYSIASCLITMIHWLQRVC